MPILPLDHPEPFAATLGVMLFPGQDDGDVQDAKAFAAQYLAKPVRAAMEAGHKISYETLARLHHDTGEVLTDLEKRWKGGIWTGDLFKAYYALAQSHPEFASLENAVRVVELAVTRAGVSGSRTSILNARRQFITVAHLWAAWSIREGRILLRPEVAYDGFADFQAFLTESEILRDWGQNWQPPHANAVLPLPSDVWRVPDYWRPPERKSGWPQTGIPTLSLPDDVLAGLRPVPRP